MSSAADAWRVQLEADVEAVGAAIGTALAVGRWYEAYAVENVRVAVVVMVGRSILSAEKMIVPADRELAELLVSLELSVLREILRRAPRSVSELTRARLAVLGHRENRAREALRAALGGASYGAVE